MTDLALVWDNARWGGDLAVAGGDFVADDGLRTAVLLSLFLNAPAKPDDVLPAGADRQGWWGDALAEVPGDVTGSRLWLLAREKQLSTVLHRARDYAGEALDWLVAQRIAAAVEVSATNPAPGVLALAITLTRPSGQREVFDLLWEAST